MLSHANVCAAQAGNYYEKDDYYTQGDPDLESDTKWRGHGAAALGLDGAVDSSDFQQLLQGQSPDGQSLHSRQIDPKTHRAATDYTFSAPKSVSIAALIQKDKRVISAHDIAVQTALGVLEDRYAQTRVRYGPGLRERVQTGNIIAATFRHETSREQDPQLHTHCVVINATQLADGRWQSISNEDVLTNQKLLGEIYQNELAVQLRHHGYEIEPKGNGTFECKGYDQPLLDSFSTRTQHIEHYIERWEASLKESGGKPLHPSQRKQATLATRLRKETVPREVLLAGWQRAIESGELQLPDTPEKALNILQLDGHNQAATAAADGVGHAAERESVFKIEKAERFALEHHLGEQSFGELQSAMKGAGLISIRSKNRHTTQAAIDRERATISVMESGQGRVQPMASDFQVWHLLWQEKSLTDGQRQAIETTAKTTDQFIAWQGVAGAGKTYSLKLLAQLATEQGYDVTGYAPSAQAATVLTEEANIESNTVARLLHSTTDDRGSDEPKQAIWIVDEAGLLSAKDAYGLLKKAQAEDARVILVGDTRQLSAVEAGNPFKSLQAAGLNTAYLEESRRQKTAALRAAVVYLAAGEQRPGLGQLDRAGMIQELKQSEERQAAVVQDYMSLSPAAREQTLILSGTNVERLALTAELREALQAEGSLGSDTFTLRSLRSLDRTAAQLKYAVAYQVNEVVVPVRDYRRYGMQRREQYRVIDRDVKANQLTLQGPDGRQFTFNPSDCADKTTYAVQELPIAPGDRLKWTRNDPEKGVRNGQIVIVESVNTSGMATLRDASGEALTLDLTGQQYLDYSLVSTTYSSQGKTADQVLAAVDSTLSKEGLYVAVSRAKQNLTLYTADKGDLYKRAERSAAKENPSDYLSLFHLGGQHAENSQDTAARVLDCDHGTGDIGNRTGERIAGRSSPALQGDSRDAAGSEQLDRATARVSGGVRANAAESHRAATAASHQLEAIAHSRNQRIEQTDNRRQYRKLYRQYAEQVGGGVNVQDQDRKIGKRLLMDMRRAKHGQPLTQPDKQLAEAIMQESPEAQRRSRTEGKDSAHQYAHDVLTQTKQVKQTQQRSRSRDRGMEM